MYEKLTTILPLQGDISRHLLINHHASLQDVRKGCHRRHVRGAHIFAGLAGAKDAQPAVRHLAQKLCLLRTPSAKLQPLTESARFPLFFCVSHRFTLARVWFFLGFHVFLLGDAVGFPTLSLALRNCCLRNFIARHSRERN